MRAKTLQIIWHSKDPVFSIDFHPDGYFATGGADREIKIWELNCAADGTPGVRHAASLEGHNATVNCVRFSKTGHCMASAGDSGEVIIWKPIPAPAAAAAAADGSGSPRGATPPPLTPGSAAAATAATPAGLATSTPAKDAAAEAAAADSSSREENVVAGVKWKMAHTLRGHHDDVTDIAWAHDDAVLLTGSVENEVMLFDVHNRQNLQRLLGHRHYVQGVAWDPLGAWLVSASADRSVRVHGLKPPPSGGKASTAVKSSVQLAREFIHSATLLKRTVQAPSTPPRDAAPTAPAAAAPGADAAVTVADDGAVQQQQQQQVPAKPLQAFLFQDESLAVFFRRMSWSPDGSLLAIPAGLAKAAKGSSAGSSGSSSSGVQHTTYVYARGNWSSPVASLPCPCKASTAVKFCPLLFQLQQQQASSSDGNSSANPGSQAAAASGAEADAAAPAAAAVNLLGLPYRMVLAVATLDSVLLYDMQTLEPFLIVGPLHYAPITDITWSRDGSCLAVSSHDGYCSLVTFQPGELGVPLTDDQLPPVLLASLQKVAAAAAATAAKAGGGATVAAAALQAPVRSAAAAGGGASPVPASVEKSQQQQQQQGSAAKPAVKRIQPQAVTAGATGGSNTGSLAAPQAAAAAGGGSSSAQPRRISPSPVAASPPPAADAAAAAKPAPRRLTPTPVAAAAGPTPFGSSVIDLTSAEELPTATAAAAAAAAAATPVSPQVSSGAVDGGSKASPALRRLTPQPVLSAGTPQQQLQQQQILNSPAAAAPAPAAAPAAPQGRTALAAIAAAKAAAAKKAAARRAAEAGEGAAADGDVPAKRARTDEA